MKNIGNQYEERAAQLLLKKGYRIYGRNIRINRREIDILAIDNVNQITVIVEVKYRGQYFPQLSHKQINNLIEMGCLLSDLDPNLPILWRIDLIIFLSNGREDEQVYHYENVHF